MDRHRPALTTAGDPPGDVVANRLPWPLVAGLCAVPGVFLVVFYAWPFARLLARGVSASAIGDTLGREVTWDITWFTLWQAVVSTVLTIVVGLAPAYVLARYHFAGRRALAAMLTAVFVLPTVVMGAAVLALLPGGWERGVPAILTAHVLFNLAVVVRTVGAVLDHLPPDLEAAAATLGAPPWRTFVEITAPLLRPAILAAGSIVFVFTFTSFGVIRVLGRAGTSTIEVEVWRQATQLGDVGAAATLAVLQLVLVAVAVIWSARQQRRHGRALRLRAGATRRRPRPGTERRFVGLVAVLTGAVVAAPLVALVARSLRGRDGWSTEAWRGLGRSEVRPGIDLGIDPLGAIATSLRTTAAATLIALGIGVTAALGIAAARRAGRLLDTGLMLPIATSAVTIGFGILITFDRAPVDWRGTWWIVPVGQALVAVPFVVRAILPVLRSIDPHLQEAAATLGASPSRAWRTITWPFLRRPVVAAAGLAAAISLGEFGATSFLTRTGSATMPIAVERLLGRTGAVLQAQGYALATILAAVTIVIVLVIDATGGDRRT
ncbi:MAG: iron ABC transporter permease [Ilumatobacteraceae bacterium]